MKNRTIGAFFGLTALVSGCDENKEQNLAACTAGEMQVLAVYHQVRGDEDYISFDFYKDNKMIASVRPDVSGEPTSNWIKCNDGQNLHISYGGPKVYLLPSPEKKEIK